MCSYLPTFPIKVLLLSKEECLNKDGYVFGKALLFMINCD